jgi:hypothetical protein
VGGAGEIDHGARADGGILQGVLAKLNRAGAEGGEQADVAEAAAHRSARNCVPGNLAGAADGEAVDLEFGGEKSVAITGFSPTRTPTSSRENCVRASRRIRR